MKNKFFLATTPVFLVLQAACYWTIKLFQSDYHTFDFWIDNAIPFVPAFVYVYNLFYPYTLVCFYLLYRADREKYTRTLIAGIISVLACYAVYLVYPTVMVRPDASSLGGITGRFLAFTYAMDEPAVNCCPSIHCLVAFLVMGSGFFSDKIKKSRGLLPDSTQCRILMFSFPSISFNFDFISFSMFSPLLIRLYLLGVYL